MAEQSTTGSGAMRPLGLGEVLDVAIALVRRNLAALVVVVVVVQLPFEAASVLIRLSTTSFCTSGCRRDDLGDVEHVTHSDDTAYALGVAAIGLLTIVASIVVQVGCFRIIAEAWLGRSTSARASMAFAVRRAGSTLWLGLVTVSALLVALVLLVVPAVWLGVAWSLAFPVMLVEGIGGTKALRRSFGLVRGRWWATLGRLVVAYVMLGVLQAAVAAALVAVLAFAVEQYSVGGEIVRAAGNLVGAAFATPFVSAVVVIVYFDLRVRKEGFDLAVLAERMGGADATRPLTPTAPAPVAPTDATRWDPPVGGAWDPPVASEPAEQRADPDPEAG